jgi:hypothetical protein
MPACLRRIASAQAQFVIVYSTAFSVERIGKFKEGDCRANARNYRKDESVADGPVFAERLRRGEEKTEVRIKNLEFRSWNLERAAGGSFAALFDWGR